MPLVLRCLDIFKIIKSTPAKQEYIIIIHYLSESSQNKQSGMGRWNIWPVLSPLCVWQLKMSSVADVYDVKYIKCSASDVVNLSLRNICVS